MRTIKKNLFERLNLQAEEAEVQGLEKVAQSLTDQIEEQSKAIRKDDEFYSYSKPELDKDLQCKLWSAAVRILDFYNVKHFDATQVQELVEKAASGLVTGLCKQAGINHGVGAYEKPVYGEEVSAIEVE